MPLNQARINAINTAVHGGNGANATTAGGGGSPAPVASETITGDTFADPSASLSLYPQVTGGTGGAGAQGSAGAYTPPTDTYDANFNETITYFPGNPGGPGGNGAVGGAATLDVTGETVGSSTVAYGGSVTFTVVGTGGTGGGGGTGGSGSSGGRNSTGTGTNPNNGNPTTITATGAAGGNGGNGGTAGDGGAALAELDTLTAFDAGGSTSLNVTANAGAGAFDPGISGWAGNSGGTASSGGNGGGGGNGGAATASFTSSTVTDNYSLAVALAATGGAGAAGGTGAAGGPGETSGTPSVYRGGTNGNGGPGGNGGAATDLVSDDTLSSIFVSLTVRVFQPTGGVGGLGGTEGGVSNSGTTYINSAPGAQGSNGAVGAGTISLTNNVVAVGTILPGATMPAGLTPRLTLQLTDQLIAPPGGSTSAAPLNAGAGGNLVFSGNRFIGSGASELNLRVSGGGVTVDTLHDTLTIGGSAGNALTGFTTIDLDSNDTFIPGPGSYTVYVSTDPDTLDLSPGHGASTLYSATTADLLLNFAAYGGSLTLSQLQADTTISGGNTTISVPGDGVITMPGASFTPSASNSQFAAACYAAGTRIRTPFGPVPIERLRAGDPVTSAFGGATPVLWIGHRSVDCRHHPAPETVWPVRIAAHAFAEGLPSRDLLLSPDHAVHVDDVLIPVRCLLNGATIRQEPVDRIRYLHVELPTHDVVLAEDLPCESYLDTGNRSSFENGGAPIAMHPDFARAAWEAAACAPQITHGPIHVAVTARLEARARDLVGPRLAVGSSP